MSETFIMIDSRYANVCKLMRTVHTSMTSTFQCDFLWDPLAISGKLLPFPLKILSYRRHFENTNRRRKTRGLILYKIFCHTEMC